MVTEKKIEQVVQIAALVLLVVGCLMVLQPFLGPVLLAVGFNLARRWTESRAAAQPAASSTTPQA